MTLLFLLSGCNPSNDLDDRSMVGAKGVVVTDVVLYQGPATGEDVPVVAGRDAVLRVFYTTEDEQVGEAVTVRVDLDSGEQFDVEDILVGSSYEDDLDSTLNVALPADVLTEDIGYRVSVLRNQRIDNPDAYFPAEGSVSPPEIVAEHIFKLVVVPFAYNADGSGRVPDVSDEGIAVLEERFQQLYPVSSVEIEVHDTIDWNGAIEPTGAGWQDIGFQLAGLRIQESPAEDVYYYGVFSPAASLNAFCGQGCLLGVTLLNDSPSDVGDSRLRIAIGVGFEEVFADTMLHELGHAHGREHADCGYGIDPSSIDHDYPYDGGLIGNIAYDLVNDALVPTDFSDVMGYCDDVWISDYQYTALLTRAVNIQDSMSRRSEEPTLSGVVIAVDEHGAAWTDTPMTWNPSTGQAVPVLLETDLGLRQVEGRFVRYDHLPGGWLLVPETAPVAEFAIDGTWMTAR
jgi:hypothetical protein